jgi:hypothetical protein
LKKIEPTKTNLNKIIEWSNSRFNERRKPDFINEIQDVIRRGVDYETPEYDVGNFSQNNKGTSRGGTYQFKQKDKKPVLRVLGSSESFASKKIIIEEYDLTPQHKIRNPTKKTKK